MDAQARELVAAPAVDGSLVAGAREHVHRRALAHERLGELAHVPREPALDDRWVLPREDKHAVAHPGDPITQRPDTRSRPAAPFAPASASRTRLRRACDRLLPRRQTPLAE